MSCIRSCYDKDSSNFGHDDCQTCIHKDAPPQRKPLNDEMRKQMKESCDSDNMEMRGAFIDGWLSAEAAHGIKE